jgi:hypothetical protein
MSDELEMMHDTSFSGYSNLGDFIIDLPFSQYISTSVKLLFHNINAVSRYLLYPITYASRASYHQ